MSNPLPNPTKEEFREYGWRRSPLRNGKNWKPTLKAKSIFNAIEMRERTLAATLSKREQKL